MAMVINAVQLPNAQEMRTKAEENKDQLAFNFMEAGRLLLVSITAAAEAGKNTATVRFPGPIPPQVRLMLAQKLRKLGYRVRVSETEGVFQANLFYPKRTYFSIFW